MLSCSSRESPGAEPCLALAGCQALTASPLAHIALPATACHYRVPGELSAPLASLSSLPLEAVLFVCSGGVDVVELRRKLGLHLTRPSVMLPIWLN